MRRAKLQSAMEYLMTYGWSILIIAIVLAAVFSLGVFGNGNLAPKAQPGSCRVYRPGGAGSITNLNLEGTCNAELPEYAFYMNVTGSSYVKTSSTLPNLTQATIIVWINKQSVPSGANDGGSVTDNSWCGLYWAPAGSTYIAGWVQNCPPINNFGGLAQITIPTNQWIMLAYTFNSAGVVNGYGFTPSQVYTASQTAANVFYAPPQVWQIGGSWFSTAKSGFWMSNVQIYNTPLSQNDLQAIYQEGIGGAPTEPQYLVAWWPLNGDFNDYGGNGYNAKVTTTGNFVFTNSWTNGYTTT